MFYFSLPEAGCGRAAAIRTRPIHIKSNKICVYMYAVGSALCINRMGGNPSTPELSQIFILTRNNNTLGKYVSFYHNISQNIRIKCSEINEKSA